MSHYVTLTLLVIILIVVLINMGFLIWFYNTYNNDKDNWNDALDDLDKIARACLGEDICDPEPVDDCCIDSCGRKKCEPEKKKKKYKTIFDFAGRNCD